MFKALKISFLFTAVLWAVRIFDTAHPSDLNQFGILPRIPESLPGILFSPLLHADFLHLISNTFPVFFLLFVVLYFYEKSAFPVFLTVWILGGLLVWSFGRDAVHIGASGLIYGFASFLVFSGIFRKNIKSILIAVLIVGMYGGMVYGILPLQSWISWEGHLAGAAAGAVSAYILRNKKQITGSEQS